jgi:signal peptidase II
MFKGIVFKTIVSRLLALSLLLTTIGCDRVTKHLAVDHLRADVGRSYLGDVVRLEYAENSGAFLSAGSRLPDWARTLLFQICVPIALAALAFVAIKQRWTGMLLVGASLVFAGGVSNSIDRFARDTVVDFMSLGIGPLRTGIFNVADVAVLLGTALLVLESARNRPLALPKK